MENNIGHGMDFKRSADGTSAGAMSTVGEVFDITPPALQRDAVEKTHYNSPEGWREFFGGLKDGSEVGLDLNFDPADPSTALFLADLDFKDPRYYEVHWPGGTVWSVMALLTEIGPEAPLDDRLVASFTFKISGKPGFA